MELRFLAPFVHNLSTLLSFGCNVVRVLPRKLKKTARADWIRIFTTCHGAGYCPSQPSCTPETYGLSANGFIGRHENVGCAPWLSLDFPRSAGGNVWRLILMF